MNNYISLRTTYFPSSLTGEQKTAAFNVPGFSDCVGGSVVGRSLLAETWKSWIDGEVEFNGKKVKTMICGALVEWLGDAKELFGVEEAGVGIGDVQS